MSSGGERAPGPGSAENRATRPWNRRVSPGSREAACRGLARIPLRGVVLAGMIWSAGFGQWTQAASFLALPPLETSRFYHTATLLPNGKVLVAGGYATNLLASAELFDPATGAWQQTVLGSATEISGGQFQFADSQAKSYLRRFYRVLSP